MKNLDKSTKNVVLLISVVVIFFIIISLSKIFENSFEIGALILLVGLPSVIINYFSKKITPKKYNFILLPIISLPLVFFFSVIHGIFFEDTSDMKGLALALYIAMSFIFLVIFSLIMSLFRLHKKDI